MCGPVTESDVQVEQSVLPGVADAHALEIMRAAVDNNGTVLDGLKSVRYHDSRIGENADETLSLFEEIGLDTSGVSEQDARVAEALVHGGNAARKVGPSLGTFVFLSKVPVQDRPRVEALFTSLADARVFITRLSESGKAAPATV